MVDLTIFTTTLNETICHESSQTMQESTGRSLWICESERNIWSPRLVINQSVN